MNWTMFTGVAFSVATSQLSSVLAVSDNPYTAAEQAAKSDMGKWLMLAGLVLVLVGLAVHTGMLSWFGRLPGDIRVERPGFTFYLPITSMVIVSVLLSVALQLLRRWF